MYQGPTVQVSRAAIWLDIEDNVITDHFIGSQNILSGLGILRAEKSFGAETPSCILTDQTLFLHSSTNFVILSQSKPEIYDSKYYLVSPQVFFENSCYLEYLWSSLNSTPCQISSFGGNEGIFGEKRKM